MIEVMAIHDRAPSAPLNAPVAVPQSGPPVSIVLYVHNGGAYLPLALDSILAQSHSHFELCVVDDGSTDRTAELLAKAASGDGRVRVRQQGWLGSDGLHETFNNVLAMTRHDLIAIANADDIWLPDKLTTQLQAFAADPDLDICYHEATFIDAEGRVCLGSFGSVPSKNPTPSPRPWQFVGGNPIPNPTVMFHRSILRRIGLQESGQMHDYQFWFKAALHGCRFLGLPDRLIRYRVHEGSESTATAKRERITRLHRECAEMMVRRHGFDQLFPELAATSGDTDSIAWAYSHLGCLFWKTKATDAAAAAWSEALRLSDNAAILGNLGVVALRRGDHHRGRQLLSRAGANGDERAARLLHAPDLLDDILPQIWLGPAPLIATLVEQHWMSPSAHRLPLADRYVVVDDQTADADAIFETFADLAHFRGAPALRLNVLASGDNATQAVVRAYSVLHDRTPDLAENLEIELLQARGDELESIVAAHLLEGAIALDLPATADPTAALSATPRAGALSR